MQRIKAVPDLRGLILVVMTCAWLVGILVEAWLDLSSFALLVGAGIAFMLVIACWHHVQGRLVTLMLLCLLLGAWRYSTVSSSNDPHAISAFIGASKLEVRGTVADEPKLQRRIRLLLIDVSGVSKDGGNSWQDADGQMEAQAPDTLIDDPYGANYGDSVKLQGRLQAPQLYSAPGISASMVFPGITVQSKGGNPVIAALYALRVKLAGIIAQSLPQPEAALLIAIVLGLRTPALGPLSNAFKVTGTAHLIVPSGFKVTILAGLVASSTRWLYEKENAMTGLLLPAQKERARWRHWIATALVLASIAAYTILSGAGPAAIRAGIMGMLMVVAPRLGRIYNIYTALALAALLMSLFDPFVLWDSGFQLSLLGTLGIVLFTPLFQRLLHPMELLPAGHHIAELIAVTLAAQTATLPIFASTFQNISLIAPIANVLTVPLLGTLILLGVLICGVGLFFAPLAVICGWVAWPLLWYVSAIVTWCSAIPGAYLQTGNLDSSLAWVYYGLLAIITGAAIHKWPGGPQVLHINIAPPLLSRSIWRTIQFAAALMMVLATGTMALAAKPDGRLMITFLNVDPLGKPAQGEAILVSTPDGKTILIDGGLDPTSLGQELDGRLPFWQRSLDMVVLTSPRSDHLLGLQDVISRYQVGEVVDAGMLHPNSSYALWRRTIEERGLHYVQVRQGTTIAIGAQVMLQVLWPLTPLHKSSDEERDNALVIRLVAPGLRVLLLGAAAESKFALNGLLTDIDQSYLQANIVQIIGEVNKAFPTELSAVLRAAHPSQLVITPAALSAKQSKAGITTVVPPSLLVFGESSWQVIQTAQVGTIEASSNESGWNILGG